MKRHLLLSVCWSLFTVQLFSQVTQINSNHSLRVTIPINSSKAITVSDADSSIWVTDGTLAGTVQIAPSVKYVDDGGLLGGKVIFEGYTPATGTEVYITDGTTGGTTIVKDIYTGTNGSDPEEFVQLGSYLYFVATTAAEGTELWRTDGTGSGTTLVKDVVPGTDSSNDAGSYNLYSNGSYLLFAAKTAAGGVELWKSDGTGAGTALLKDINTGADSSNPRDFFTYNNMVLFAATDDAYGEELWKTDGTAGGTVLVKDINPGTGSSTSIAILPGFNIPLLNGFHIFNNKAVFNASDGASNGELWVTDGTTANTILLKNIVSGTIFDPVLLLDAINLPGKFVFPVSDHTSRSELWESDGTPAGTQLLKSFNIVTNSDFPFIFLSYTYNFSTGALTTPLFQGNKFFLSAATTAQGNELWISDGTAGGTTLVKDINPGAGNGINDTASLSYFYTTAGLYFAADDGTNGDEVWKSNGTAAGTTLVANINPGAANADPDFSFLLVNNKIIFGANNGDDPELTDLYSIDGTFTSLPVKLTDFTVTLKEGNGLLSWSTAQELNAKNYVIQRSFDAQHFDNIGAVQAAGNTGLAHAYNYTDAAIANSGKNVLYYRLLMTDADGKTAFSNVIALRLKGSAPWTIRIVNNPVRDNVSLLLDGVSGDLKLNIYDMAGRSLYTQVLHNTNGQVTLPVALQSGSYILDAQNNHERKTLKLIKQ